MSHQRRGALALTVMLGASPLLGCGGLGLKRDGGAASAPAVSSADAAALPAVAPATQAPPPSSAASPSPSPSPNPSTPSSPEGASDADVCAYLDSLGPLIQPQFAEAYAGLCKSSGLATLRASVGKVSTGDVSADDPHWTPVRTASAVLGDGTPAGALKLAALFCSDFSAYEAALGAAAFATTVSVTPSGAAANGCAFEQKLTPLLPSDPEGDFIGQRQSWMNEAGTVTVTASYLTREVGEVKEQATLIITAAISKDRVVSYLYAKTTEDTGGWRGNFVDRMTSDTLATLNALAPAIATFSH